MLPYCACAPCIQTDKQNYNIDSYDDDEDNNNNSSKCQKSLNLR